MFGLFQTDEQRLAEYKQDRFMMLCKCTAIAMEHRQYKLALELIRMIEKHYVER